MTTLATEAVEQAVAPERESKEESLNYASQLPEPKGYKLLIALPWDRMRMSILPDSPTDPTAK